MTFQISSPCNIPNAFQKQKVSFKKAEDYSDSRMTDGNVGAAEAYDYLALSTL